MSRARSVFLGALVVIVLSGALTVTQAAARAPMWLLGGTPLTKAIRAKSKAGGAGIKLVRTFGGKKYKVTCTEAANEEELLTGQPGKDALLAIAFEKCKVEEPSEAGCKAIVTPLRISEWTSTLIGSGGKFENEYARFEAEVTITGCTSAAGFIVRLKPLKGVVANVAGGVTVEVKGSEEESEVSGVYEYTAEGGTLEAGEEPIAPEILPVPSKASPLKFTSKSDNEKNFLEAEVAGSAIECKEATSESEFTSANSGTGEIDLHSCKSALNGAKCKTLGGSEAGVIVANVGWSLVDVLLPKGEPSPELMLVLAAVLPASLVHIECSATLLVLLGSIVLGEFTKLAESGLKTKEGVVTFAQTKGVQKVKECLYEEKFCSGKTFGLYVELGKGTEKAGEQSEDTLTFEKEAAFDY
jgi:hypothetical protein